MYYSVYCTSFKFTLTATLTPLHNYEYRGKTANRAAPSVVGILQKQDQHAPQEIPCDLSCIVDVSTNLDVQLTLSVASTSRL